MNAKNVSRKWKRNAVLIYRVSGTLCILNNSKYVLRRQKKCISSILYEEETVLSEPPNDGPSVDISSGVYVPGGGGGGGKTGTIRA